VDNTVIISSVSFENWINRGHHFTGWTEYQIGT